MGVEDLVFGVVVRFLVWGMVGAAVGASGICAEDSGCSSDVGGVTS